MSTQNRIATAGVPRGAADPVRTGLGVQAIKRAVLDNLTFHLGRMQRLASPHDYYMALAYAVRDRLLQRWMQTHETYANHDVKVACPRPPEDMVGRVRTRRVNAFGHCRRDRRFDHTLFLVAQ